MLNSRFKFSAIIRLQSSVLSSVSLCLFYEPALFVKRLLLLAHSSIRARPWPALLGDPNNPSTAALSVVGW